MYALLFAILIEILAQIGMTQTRERGQGGGGGGGVCCGDGGRGGVGWLYGGERDTR